jgi:hypothetical protein
MDNEVAKQVKESNKNSPSVEQNRSARSCGKIQPDIDMQQQDEVMQEQV